MSMLGLAESHLGGWGVRQLGQLFFGWLNEIFVKALKVFIIVEAAATDDASLVDDGEAHGIG